MEPLEFDPVANANRIAKMTEDERIVDNLKKIAVAHGKLFLEYTKNGFTRQEAIALVIGFMQTGKK